MRDVWVWTSRKAHYKDSGLQLISWAQLLITAMIDVGYLLDPQISQVMESLVLTGSLFTAIGLVTIWLLVSCLTKSGTSAAILAVVDLIISLEATAVTTSLTS